MMLFKINEAWRQKKCIEFNEKLTQASLMSDLITQNNKVIRATTGLKT